MVLGSHSLAFRRIGDLYGFVQHRLYSHFKSFFLKIRWTHIDTDIDLNCFSWFGINRLMLVRMFRLARPDPSFLATLCHKLASQNPSLTIWVGQWIVAPQPLRHYGCSLSLVMWNQFLPVLTIAALVTNVLHVVCVPQTPNKTRSGASCAVVGDATWQIARLHQILQPGSVVVRPGHRRCMPNIPQKKRFSSLGFSRLFKCTFEYFWVVELSWT